MKTTQGSSLPSLGAVDPLTLCKVGGSNTLPSGSHTSAIPHAPIKHQISAWGFLLRTTRKAYMAKAGRNTSEWVKLRKMCFKRDKSRNAKCWLCHQPIDYSVKPSSTDDSWEPDHRHSVHTHPELAEVPENVYPSHRKCNRTRKDKAGLSNLGRTTREW